MGSLDLLRAPNGTFAPSKTEMEHSLLLHFPFGLLLERIMRLGHPGDIELAVPVEFERLAEEQ